ncbi:MAG: hypothetical protein M1511_15000 [Deltaproteobacteria bacterium]|nr:hypothetical protein [Deltaproteobacteria bacterium]
MPSQKVLALLEPVVPLILAQVGTRGLIALAVVGSAARSEETWHEGKLVGDIDLAAVVRVPDLLTLHRFQFPRSVLGENISIGVFPLYSIKRYRTLEFYEAKETGWVLWGKADVFDCVRIKNSKNIPKWEGIRLALNRVMECLRARSGLLPTWYAAVKSYLALGEADLVFSGEYVPSYCQRLELLEKRGEILGSRELLNLFRSATDIKLGRSIPGNFFENEEHENWLLFGLKRLISNFLEEEVAIQDGLERISKENVHLIHRTLFLLRHRYQPHYWPKGFWKDPIFDIWATALQVIGSDLQYRENELIHLVKEWEQVHQPLPS